MSIVISKVFHGAAAWVFWAAAGAVGSFWAAAGRCRDLLGGHLLLYNEAKVFLADAVGILAVSMVY